MLILCSLAYAVQYALVLGFKLKAKEAEVYIYELGLIYISVVLSHTYNTAHIHHVQVN